MCAGGQAQGPGDRPSEGLSIHPPSLGSPTEVFTMEAQGQRNRKAPYDGHSCARGPLSQDARAAARGHSGDAQNSPHGVGMSSAGVGGPIGRGARPQG